MIKFKDASVERKNYNVMFLTWSYLPYKNVDDNRSFFPPQAPSTLAPAPVLSVVPVITPSLEFDDFIIRISVAGIKEGPFQIVGEIPSSMISFEYPLFFRKWMIHYYKLEVVGKDGISDTRIVELPEHIDPYVKKMREKYDLYLSKRVKNPIKIYKKKKIGHRCKRCWDPKKDEFIKTHCKICFGTGYGDDNIFGASDLQVDGWLKKNDVGNLEFFRQDWNFESYPAINSNIDFGLYNGDEFRIENDNGDPLLSLNVLGSADNSIYLNYDERFINYLDGNNFSVYGLENKKNFDILNRLLYDPESNAYRLYLKEFNFKNIEFDSISFGENQSFTGEVIKIYDNYVLFNTADIILDDLSKVIFMNGGTIVSVFNSDKWFINLTDRSLIWSINNDLNTGDRLYVDYYFNGVSEVLVGGKTKKISSVSEPQKSLAYFTVISNDEKIADLKVETLSNYIPLIPENIFVNNFILMSFGSSVLNVHQYHAKERYAMYKAYQKLSSNTIYKINQQNIKKDAFAGCGVLLIDIVEGKTYRGPTWDGTQFINDGDFYVNQDMTEFNTLDLEEKFYEVTYIYKLKNLKFNSYFIPINFEFTEDKVSTVTWKFKHPNLINKENLVGKKITISEKDIYEEFDIKTYDKELGIVECENDLLDSDDFYNNLTSNAIFNVIYPHTGGYYSAINSWINYLNSLSKTEVLAENGPTSDVTFNSITYYYPRIEPDDIIFDVKTKIFYVVERVNTPYFRRAEIYQMMFIKEVPGGDQDELYSLLER